MAVSPPDTEQLLRQAAAGADAARQQLVSRHRDRLRRMIGVRLDPRLNARMDPSDVVQEVLLEAHQKLDDFLRTRPLPFYPWLRQIAWQCLARIHRDHLQAQKRRRMREQPLGLPESSAWALAGQLAARGSSPSERLERREQQRRVRQALDTLGERDREVLVLRHLEQLSVREVAAVLGVSEGAVKTRHVRALARLQGLLSADSGEEEP